MRKAIAAALGAAAVLAVTLTSAASAGTSPGWLHVQHTGHRHHGHPCVVVWGGRGDTSALVCEDGYAATS